MGPAVLLELRRAGPFSGVQRGMLVKFAAPASVRWPPVVGGPGRRKTCPFGGVGGPAWRAVGRARGCRRSARRASSEKLIAEVGFVADAAAFSLSRRGWSGPGKGEAEKTTRNGSLVGCLSVG